MRNTKLACRHLRNVMKYRLKAWEESSMAEEMLEQDIDSSSDAVDYALSYIDRDSEIDAMSDEDVMKVFEISPVQEEV